MHAPYLRDWHSEANTVLVTDEATPDAESQLLVSAVQAVLEVATTPYCGTGHLYEGGTAGLTDRYLACMVAPAAEHCRIALANAFGATAAAIAANTWWTTDGGTAGANVNTVPGSHLRQRVYVPTAVVAEELIESGTWENDVPAATSNRWGELQSLLVSYVEPMYVSQACGVAVYVCEQAPDMEVL